MHPEICTKLVAINHTFYQTFGPAFAATRRRIQPGVRKVLERIPPNGRWLDLGCGSSALAAEWAKQGRSGLYLGLDFSLPLLDEARQSSKDLRQDLEVRFHQADLAQLDWVTGLSGQHLDGALSFAALHHIPGFETRLGILRAVRSLLPPGALFIHSEWQFQNSPKLLARRQPWSLVDLNPADLDEGDTLLDWRYALPNQAEQTGLRYVHLFSREELQELSEKAGFKIQDEFESDGDGGRLSLYQFWQAL
jgi:SAM-dependent methyltransferase